jgi:hypothetical protein
VTDGDFDERMKDLMSTAFSMGRSTADAWWIDFVGCLEHESTAWMAFAACMAGLGPRITRALKVYG